MKRIMKKIAVSAMMFVACFACVVAVNAASATTTLYNGNSITVTKNSVGQSFTTVINATSIYYVSPISIKTQAGRKMFNITWYDSGTATTSVGMTNHDYPTSWTSHGTYDTRATWTNMTSGGYLDATFSLN